MHHNQYNTYTQLQSSRMTLLAIMCFILLSVYSFYGCTSYHNSSLTERIQNTKHIHESIVRTSHLRSHREVENSQKMIIALNNASKKTLEVPTLVYSDIHLKESGALVVVHWIENKPTPDSFTVSRFGTIENPYLIRSSQDEMYKYKEDAEMYVGFAMSGIIEPHTEIYNNLINSSLNEDESMVVVLLKDGMPVSNTVVATIRRVSNGEETGSDPNAINLEEGKGKF